jgi:hypothetical protein
MSRKEVYEMVEDGVRGFFLRSVVQKPWDGEFSVVHCTAFSTPLT